MKRNKLRSRRTTVMLCCILVVLLLLLGGMILALSGSEQDSILETEGTAAAFPTETVPESVTPSVPVESAEPTDAEESIPTEEETAPPEEQTEPDTTQASAQTQKPSSGKDVVIKAQIKVKTPNEELTCSTYSLFSGQYVEDGRDELVENVAAILVTNNTDRFLDLATLYFRIDGKDASFIVTGLPAGESAWVMEATKMQVTHSSEFVYLDCMSAFRDDVVASTDKITISADGNMLTATNNTGKTLENVCVYYRTVHTDGNFFGGITYLVDFGTLEPGQSAETLAGHYDGSKTKIVRIGWQTG